MRDATSSNSSRMSATASAVRFSCSRRTGAAGAFLIDESADEFPHTPATLGGCVTGAASSEVAPSWAPEVALPAPSWAPSRVRALAF